MTSRELDALVAEKVMGWTWNETSAWSPRGSMYARVHPYLEKHDIWSWLPNYSTCILAAWEVVDHLDEENEVIIAGPKARCEEEQRWYFEITHKVTRAWWCAHGETAPEAICLAALKAVGVTP